MIIPVIERITPELPLRCEAIRRTTSDTRRAALLIQAKEFRIRPDISRIRTYIDRQIPDNSDSLLVRSVSFGFKEGIASDADLVFDVRCLPNPYYIEELKNHTGLEDCIREYVFGFEESRELLSRVLEFLNFLLPLYRKEGKRELVVAFGCTGGQHRSVCFAEALAAHMRETGQRVVVNHRELEKSRD